MKTLKSSITLKTPTLKTPTLHTKPVRSYPIGINHNITSFMSHTTLRDSYIPLFKKAGIKWVRFEMVMVDQQNTEGVFTFESGASYNSKVTHLRNAGLEIIGLMDLYSMPTWAKTFGSGTFARPTTAVYATWITNAVNNWINKIRFWEMSNEPNWDSFWNNAPDAAEYFDYLVAGYNAVKAADPNSKVISAGLGSIPPAYGNSVTTTEYLDELLSLGLDSYCDYIGIHPYAQPPSNATFQDVLDNIDEWRTLQLSYGSTKPWIITEQGWTTYTSGGIDETEQATLAASLWDTVMNDPDYSFIKVVNWHNFRESTDANDPEHNYGLVNYPNLDEKPAYQSFVDAKNSFRSTYRELVIA